MVCKPIYVNVTFWRSNNAHWLHVIFPHSTFWGVALTDITTVTESLDIRRDRRPKKMFSKTQVSFTLTKVTGKGRLVGVGQNGSPLF
jgi:hypothetical protein